MIASKKDVEIIYFDRFKALLPNFPVGSIELTEEPDFLIRGEKLTIGVELTELHKEVPVGEIPQQATEAIRHRVTTRAQQIYVASGYPPVRVSVFMNSGHIKKDDVEPLARALAEIAFRNLPEPNSSTEEEYEWANRAYFPPILNKVTVNRLDVITDSFFSCPGTTWVTSLRPMDVQRALRLKESKYTTYRIKCDATWLVINIDVGAMSTWFQFDSEDFVGKFQTSFDRIFLLHHFGSELHELDLQQEKP